MASTENTDSTLKTPEHTPRANKLLMLVAHPDLDSSRANLALMNAARQTQLIDIIDLYDVYANMFVDGAAERARLADYNTIILQYPIYWYQAPSLLKEWFDRTLKHGWAYGEGGDALKGKNLLCSVTTGSDDDAYTPTGYHGLTTIEMLKPIEQLARFCQMNWLDPFIFHTARRLSDSLFEARCASFATRLRQIAQPEHRLNVANSNSPNSLS